MPVHLRALVVILLFAVVVFALARRPASEAAVADADFLRRRNLWFAVTLIAFLSHNFWLFIGLTAIVLGLSARREHNAAALFAWLMFAVPPFSASVSGLGVFKQLIEIDYLRLLAIVLLVPAYFRLRGQRLGWLPTDFFIAGFLLIPLALRLDADTATNTARHGVYALLDVVLPYYVASRSLRDLRSLRDVAMSFAVAASILALVAIFEAGRHWLLYKNLEEALDVRWGYGNYLGRNSILRAQGSTGQPIALGYALMAALCLYAAVSDGMRNATLRRIGFALLAGGLGATLSRGPWVGAAAAAIAFQLARPKALGGFVKLLLVTAITSGLVLVSPLGPTVLEYLPFVGTIDEFNITYRQRLMEVSLQLIAQHPWFGVSDFYYKLSAEDLKTGGMIDIVNTYVGIGLANGVIVLACFVGAFASALVPLYLAGKRNGAGDAQLGRMAAALIAALAGTLVTIMTTSSVTVIPVIYWLLIGMAAACNLALRRGVPAALPGTPPASRRAGVGGPRPGVRA